MSKSTGFLHAHRLGRKMVKENDFNIGLCAFGVVNGDNREDYKLRAPCHAALSRMDVCFPTLMVDVQYKRGKGITSKMAKMFTNYVLMQSPYASIFAEKNTNAGFARGYFLYRTDVDANLLTGGAVLLRMLSESPMIPKMWYHMVMAGVSPDMAILVAHMSSLNNGEVAIRASSDDCHKSIVPSWFLEKDVINFINRNHKVYGKYIDMGGYMGFTSMWGADRYNRNTGFSAQIHGRWIAELKRLHNMKDGRVAIFDHDGQKKRNRASEKCQFKTAMPIIAKILNDYRKELNV